MEGGGRDKHMIRDGVRGREGGKRGERRIGVREPKSAVQEGGRVR